MLPFGAWVVALIWTLVILTVGRFNAQQTAKQRDSNTTGVTLSVKHLDLHESILTFEALEEYLQKTTEYG